MALKSLIDSSSSRPTTEFRRLPKIEMLKRVLLESFDFTTILLIGAFAQGVLVLLVPRLWIMAPTFVILLTRFSSAMAITKGWAQNPYTKDSIPHRATAVIPNTEGEFNKQGVAADEKVAIFLLGLRSNHPLGYFAPHMAKINELTTRMQDALDDGSPDNGYLGQSNWTSRAENGGLDLLLISYWRSNDDVLRFAAGPSHKETWAWWEAHAPELKHIGISHEVFEASKSQHENLYINFQPTRMGSLSFFRPGDESVGGSVPDTWVNPLVDAKGGKLRTARGRLGWANTESMKGESYSDDEKKNDYYGA